MFARLFAIASLAALAVAGNAHLAARGQCDTGSISCCNQMVPTSEVYDKLSKLDGIAALVDLPITSATGCRSIGAVSALNSGANCNQQPVCCDNNYFDSTIGVGCSPINVN